MHKTAIFRDSLFLDHDPGFDHPESPERLKVIYELLDREEIKKYFLFPKFDSAPRSVITLNHTEDHFQRVAETAGKIFDALDPDTKTSPDSYAAATLAVGALTKGIDLLVEGEIDNGFALIRPPGHHAEAHRSMGFCLFNNVAIAARYAMSYYGMKRVMIVDWDLHHGNGTQHSFYDTDKVLYVSTHQFPYYPGTGDLSETGTGKGEGYTVNIPLPGHQGDIDYGTVFDDIIVPIGRQYQPELILVSCGFDIYLDDPLGAMNVTASGFAYLARSMISLAEEVCGGKILFTLEGGYNLTGQCEGAMAVLSELVGQPLAGSPDSCVGMEKSLHPAIDEARDVAKRFWKL